jgi:transposase
VLAKHGLGARGSCSPFTKKGWRELEASLPHLPEHTRFVMERMLEHLDFLSAGLAQLEARMDELFAGDPRMSILRTLPSVGPVLASVILSEVGYVSRFPSPGQFLSYCGLVPCVHSSGGRTHFGRLRPDANRPLKRAFTEAANSVAAYRRLHPERHAVRLYERIRAKRSHGTAVGAVARHLAEAAYWMLVRSERYHDPSIRGEFRLEG